MSDNAILLDAYVKEGSEPAFRELVGRHIPLVMATARRIVAGDEHLAQDVTQLVFTDLARKAETLPPGVVLGGWLHRHTCFTAAKVVRTESRRRTRERTAMENDALTESSARDEHWRQLAPVLDEALNHLDTADRDAVVLRYFEQRDLRAIGAALGISDDTAQKRIARALDKLRDILTQRGMTLSSALLATALDAGAVAGPVASGLTATISTAALSSATAAASTTLLTSTLKIMATSKITLGVAALIVAASATLLVVQNKTASSPIVTNGTTPAAQAPVTPNKTAAVETPKAAPAPAGGNVASPASAAVTATTGTLSFNGTSLNNTQLSKWPSNYSPSGSGAPPAMPFTASTSNPMNPPSNWAAVVADERSKLEQTRQREAERIALRTTVANGDPAVLAKIAESQQQYDDQILAQQKKIDALETDPAAQAAYIIDLQSQLAELKKNLPGALSQAAGQAKYDPRVLEIAQRMMAKQLQEKQKAIDGLSASLPPASLSAAQAALPSAQAALIAAKRADLEKFKAMTEEVLKQAMARANGDPAELAKMEAARKQYDDYAQQKQQEIDALEAQPTP